MRLFHRVSKEKMKIRFFSFLMWLLFFGSVLVGGLGLNLTKVEAQALPTVQFATSATSGSEKIANPEIKVTLSAIANTDVMVDYKITGGDAVLNEDYVLSDNTLVISHDRLSNNIPLRIIDNKKFNLNRSIEITLSNPVNSRLGLTPTLTYTILEDNTPTTTLVKDPAAALGQNGWFTVKPDITLSVDRTATTYYQWDGHRSGEWLIYNNSFSALEGDHTLYYYSTDGHGFRETLQSETFKVDIKHPVAPILNIIVNDNGKVQLSWQKISDVAKFKIFRDGRRIATLSRNAITFDDWISTNGKNHSYSVIAFDVSGNMSRSEVSSVKVVAIAPTIVLASSEVTEIKPAVEKQIGTGISTSVAQTAQEPTVTPQVQGESQVIDTPRDTEDTPTESRNWNKLLLIISILIISAGVATGGYYGYERYMNRKDDGTGSDSPKNKSRW